MKGTLATILLLLTLASVISAQSGRVRVEPTPTPTPGKKITYMPTQPMPSVSPTPDAGDDVLKIESALVPIPVSVTDANGRSVTGLTLKDIEVRVDGKPVEISELVRSDSPVRLAMLFDNSSSVMIARDFEKDAAVRFFRRVVRPDRDMAALFSLADATRLEQPLTRDISLLTRAIDLFPPPKGATALLDGLIQVAQYMTSAAGRRVVVLVSDGEDTTSDLSTTLEDVVRALQLADCQVYVVKTKDVENYKRTGIRGGNANIRTLTAERRMIDISEQTGGAVYSPIDEKEMDAAFSRISAELADQYILHYYPDEESETPGTTRRIEVIVKGKPNLTVRARTSYYVTKR